jgi:hypothetical protein
MELGVIFVFCPVAQFDQPFDRSRRFMYGHLLGMLEHVRRSPGKIVMPGAR